jgi:type II secretory pathway component PulC
VESPAAASADQSAEAGKAPPPRGTLVQGLGRGLDAIAQSARFTSALNLNAVIRFLWVVIVVLFALMIYYVGFVKGGTVPEAVADTGGPGPVVASSSVQAPSLQEIQQQLASRNMFQPPGTGSKPEDKGKLPPVEMKDLKLTGVAWDPGAEGALVALIWDEGRKMTYFVKETESLGDTGIVVQKVHRDRVKLEQAGKEWELR